MRQQAVKTDGYAETGQQVADREHDEILPVQRSAPGSDDPPHQGQRGHQRHNPGRHAIGDRMRNGIELAVGRAGGMRSFQ